MMKILLIPMVNYIKELFLELELREAEHNEGIEFPNASLIGSVLYLSTHTTPDLTFSVGILSIFIKRPATAHR